MRNNLLGKSIPSFIAILVVLFYLCFVMYHTVNILFADDIHLLETVLWMEQTPSWAERYRLIMLQHNEHRIVVPRLLTWLVSKIFGQIYWPSLVFIGSVAWCAVCLILWKSFKKLNLSYWLFLPIPFLIYQPQYTDNLTWSISILQQSGIVFLYLLIIYLVSQNKLWLPLFLACIATYTHGSGIFSFLVVILLLALKQQWKTLRTWALVGVIMAAWFFTDYAGGQSANIPESLSNPARLLGSAMAFLGASTTAFDRYGIATTPAIVLGIFITSIVIGFLIKTFKRLDEPIVVFFWGCIFFVGLTVSLVAVSRSWQGIEIIIAPRYIHYSPLALALVYLMLMYLLPRFSKIIGIAFLAYALVFNGFSYYKYTQEVILRQESLKADIYNWNHHQSFLNYGFQFNWNIRPICKDAEKVGLSTISKQNWELPQQSVIDSTIQFETIFYKMGKQSYYAIFNKVLDYKGFMVLEAENKERYVCGIGPRANAKMAFLKTAKYAQNGFQTFLLVDALKKGKYKMGVYQNGVVKMSNQFLEIKASI